MPTYDVLESFRRDLEKLTPEQRNQLRVPVTGHDSIWELTWAADGRATFEFGAQRRPGEAHVVWRRLGTHSVFDQP